MISRHRSRDAFSPAFASALRKLACLGLILAPRCSPDHAESDATGGPELYGAGLFSTGAWDFFIAFAPDGKYALFCRANADFSRYEILETRRDPGGWWRAPTNPRFAASWSNADPHVAPDGRTLYFISNRPDSGTVPRTTYDVWASDLRPDGQWEDARRLPAPVSDAAVDEWSPSVAANGTLYFGSDRPGGHGGLDIWRVRRIDGAYQTAENLGPMINSAADEVEPWIAPDESYLIFSAKHRPDSVGAYDLYYSLRVGEAWQVARPVPKVNSAWADFNQSVSPDGQWLYFSSTRPHAGAVRERFDHPRGDLSVRGIGNGKGDMYRIPLKQLGLPPARQP